MIIFLNKFGTTLISREDGKESLLAANTFLKELSDKEIIEVDFGGVNTFSPSWADEFLTPLAKLYGDRLILHNSKNLSVIATLNLLEKSNNITFNKK